jgi:hypothetical protein
MAPRPGLGSSQAWEFGAVTLQVPKGFEAYARIFHPARESEWNPVVWAEVAKFCGTTTHPEMQWHAIVGLPRYENLEDSKWPGQEPNTGEMDISTLYALCEVLVSHTKDPARCFFGGGSAALIEAIVASPALEASRVEPTTSLAVGADKINAVALNADPEGKIS